MKKLNYYDGPVQPEDLTEEEIEKAIEEGEKKNAELTEWPPIE